MERKSYAFITGLFVFIVAGIGAGFMWWLSQSDIEYLPYDIVTEYSVGGLSPYSTVYLRGVSVGNVESIGFDETDQNLIRIRIQVDKKIKLTTGTFATLRNQGVTGLSQIVLDSKKGRGEVLATSEDDPAVIVMEQGILARLVSQGEQLMENASTVMTNMSAIVSQENAEKFTALLDNLNDASQQVASIAVEAKGIPTQAKETITLVQNTIGQSEAFITGLNSMTARLEKKINQFIRNSDKLVIKTGRLADELDGTAMPKVYETLDDISLAAKNLRGLAKSINENPQSLIFGDEEPQAGPGEVGY